MTGITSTAMFASVSFVAVSKVYIQMKLDPSDVIGKFDFLVDLDKSIERPEGDTQVITTKCGYLFPENIWLYNQNDEWLYAFGATHVWRSNNGKCWELVW